MHTFTFSMGELLNIDTSVEFGHVVARAEYAHGEDMYLLRYRAADGRAVEQWWGESALSTASLA
jgi:hypothetical protein